MLERLFNGSLGGLEKGLDGNAARLRAIGENIANIDTPGYKRHEVTFEGQMQSALGQEEVPLATTQPGHLSVGPSSMMQVTPMKIVQDGTTMRNDGNNVDIDSELTKLAQTQMTYNALSELAKRRMENIKTVLRETK